MTYALIFYLLSQLLSTIRLGWIIEKIGIKISLVENFKLYLIGMSYNLFLPGGIGGDGYKLIIYRSSHHVTGKKVFMALLLERVLGLVAIFILLATILSFTKIPLQYPPAWLLFCLPIIYFVSNFLSYKSIYPIQIDF